jgi:hypothetical protein
MVDPMNPGGIFLGISGVWVLCQVFPGRALQRLNVLSTKADATPATLLSGVFSGVASSVGESLWGGITGLPGKIINKVIP